MAKSRFIICEALQAVSAVMAILGVIEVKYDGARQLKWFKCAAVWHNVIFWPRRLIFSTSSGDGDTVFAPGLPACGAESQSIETNKIAGARSSATMRVARVVLATLALIASSSVALDDAGDAAAPSPAVNPGASAEAAGGFPTTTDVNLMRWISEKGGAFAGVGVYSFVASSEDSDVADSRYGSRAMYAKEAEVPNGAEVFRLPSSAVMIAPSEAAGPACLNRLASLDPEWALAAMILRERSASHASPHAAFIDAMYAHPPSGARVGKMPRGSDADAALRETRAGDLLAGVARRLRPRVARAGHPVRPEATDRVFCRVLQPESVRGGARDGPRRVGSHPRRRLVPRRRRRPRKQSQKSQRQCQNLAARRRARPHRAPDAARPEGYRAVRNRSRGRRDARGQGGGRGAGDGAGVQPGAERDKRKLDGRTRDKNRKKDKVLDRESRADDRRGGAGAVRDRRTRTEPWRPARTVAPDGLAALPTRTGTRRRRPEPPRIIGGG